MKSRFSKATAGTTQSAVFTEYYVHEVANSLTESKYIANDLADAKRYAYRARATLVGNAAIRPYDPIYLDGLPNDMSGYWTVLSVKHIFGGTLAKYMLEVELGKDVLGDVNPEAYKASSKRDVMGELTGQSLDVSPSILSDYSLSVNASELDMTTNDKASIIVADKATTPTVDSSSPDLYQNSSPNFSIVKKTTVWKATKGSKVV